jgi:hypothetical protein
MTKENELIGDDLIDDLLKGYKKPNDLIGENGLLKEFCGSRGKLWKCRSYGKRWCVFHNRLEKPKAAFPHSHSFGC